jgi:glutathione S-transferase
LTHPVAGIVEDLMSKPKVTYFDIAGSRGEEVRLALTIAGVAFDDIRLDREAFAKAKPDLPFGSVPTFEMEGLGVIGQSNAILRLIGRQNGLHPEAAFEAARHDGFMDAVEDLRHRIAPSMRMPDGPEKVAARKQLATDYIPQWATYVERQIGAGPFVGGKLPSVADIKLFVVDRWISSGVVDGIPMDIFGGYPKLRALTDAIRTHPAVVAWYAR